MRSIQCLLVALLGVAVAQPPFGPPPNMPDGPPQGLPQGPPQGLPQGLQQQLGQGPPPQLAALAREQRPPFPLPDSCVADMRATVECLGIEEDNPMVIARHIGVFGPQDADNCLVQGGCDVDSIRLLARDILRRARDDIPQPPRASANVRTSASVTASTPTRARRQAAEASVNAKGKGHAKGKGQGNGGQGGQGKGQAQGQAGASASAQAELRTCVSEELGSSAAAHIRECMGDTLPERTEGPGPRPHRLMNILGEIVGNRERLLELCADPETAVKCAGEKMGQELTKENLQEKCACFTGPSDECRADLETLHAKACECSSGVIETLEESRCSELRGFARMSSRVRERTCVSAPAPPPQGHQPPICHAELPDDIFGLDV